MPVLRLRSSFLLDFLDELPNEVEDAVARPDSLPEVVGGVALVGGRDGRVARAAVAALVERQEAGLGPGRGGWSRTLARGPRRSERGSGRRRRAAPADRGRSCTGGWRRPRSAPVSGFFSSAVKIGMPFRKSPRSTLSSVFSLKWSWRTTAKRFAAWRRWSFLVEPARRLEVREPELAA